MKSKELCHDMTNIRIQYDKALQYAENLFDSLTILSDMIKHFEDNLINNLERIKKNEENIINS